VTHVAVPVAVPVHDIEIQVKKLEQDPLLLSGSTSLFTLTAE
jgi:hypothetical protein